MSSAQGARRFARSCWASATNASASTSRTNSGSRSCSFRGGSSSTRYWSRRRWRQVSTSSPGPVSRTCLPRPPGEGLRSGRRTHHRFGQTQRADGDRGRWCPDPGFAGLVNARVYRSHPPTNAVHYAYFTGVDVPGFLVPVHPRHQRRCDPDQQQRGVCLRRSSPQPTPHLHRGCGRRVSPSPRRGRVGSGDDGGGGAPDRRVPWHLRVARLLQAGMEPRMGSGRRRRLHQGPDLRPRDQ